MTRLIRYLLLSLLIVGPLVSGPDLAARQPVKKADWGAWTFLLGKWTGGGGGQPGQGTGYSEFYLDLQGTVLVRKNHAEFPASENRPAMTHDDLMIMHRLPDGGVRAVYFDNEGHVIHYAAEFSDDGNTLTFTSDPQPSKPRFRLVYSKAPDSTLKLTFRISPTGKTEDFHTYIESQLKKDK